MIKKWRIRLFWRSCNSIGALYRTHIVEAKSQKEAADKIEVSLHYFRENAVRIKSD